MAGGQIRLVVARLFGKKRGNLLQQRAADSVVASRRRGGDVRHRRRLRHGHGRHCRERGRHDRLAHARRGAHIIGAGAHDLLQAGHAQVRGGHTALGDEAQGAVDNLQATGGRHALFGAPGGVRGGVYQARLLRGATPVGRGGHLGAEAGGKAQGHLSGDAAAAAKCQVGKGRVDVVEVGHGRQGLPLQTFDDGGVLQGGAHGVASKSLGVGHDDVAGGGAKNVAQGLHLRRRAAAAGGGVGLVRHENEFLR